MTANSDQVMPLCCTCHMALEVKYDSNPSLEGADNKFYKIHSLFIENWPVIIHLWTGYVGKVDISACFGEWWYYF